MYWPVHVLVIHSTINVAPILSCLRWLLISLLIKLDNALKCGVAWFVMKELNKSFHLLDSFENHSLINYVHPTSTHKEVFQCRPHLRLLISHWFASNAHSSYYLPFNTIVLRFIVSSFYHFLLLPSWSEYYLFFLLRVHCIAPSCSNFQEVSRSIDVTSVKDFANSINALFVWQSLLFGNQFSYFKDHVYFKI